MVLAAIGQLTSTSTPLHNLAQATQLIHRAASLKARALFLPEASDWISSGPEESLKLVRSVGASEFVQGVRRAAREVGVCVGVGVHEPGDSHEPANGAGEGGGGRGVNGTTGGDEAPKGKVKNTLLWIDEQGEIAQRYQKLHLFDMNVTGGPNMRESKGVEQGGRICPPFQTPVGRLGLMICFDLRFPEISLSLRRQGAEVILYPSAFTPQTGWIHWEPLLRARAIETQSYLFAAAQVGQHNEKRSSYGHSMIIDPWGKILTELGGEAKGEPELATAEVDLEQVKRIREEVFLNRRTDVYSEV